MKMYRFNGIVDFEQDTKEFKQFMDDVAKRINSDEDLINRAKKINLKYVEHIQEILNHPENAEFTGKQIERIKSNIPRYAFIKNLEFDGEEYDCQIDLLMWTFTLN